MRLTLRTLLAYTDDILEPADHEDLGRKIESSDFATELIHRSRDVVRRLRLGAPEVLASGEGDGVLESIDVADANAVAEYLDNTLSPDDVADFERMCLEPGNDADMHLAEVASCHHVLTMVLGEPADIDMDVRHRMYDLPEKLDNGIKLRIEPAHVAAPQVPPQPSAEEVDAPPVVRVDAPVSEVPDYLRAATASRQRSKRLAMVAASLAVIGITGFFVTGGFKGIVPPEEVAQLDFDSAIGKVEIGDAVGDEVDPPIAVEKGAAGADSEAPAFKKQVVVADKASASIEPPVGVSANEPEPSVVPPEGTADRLAPKSPGKDEDPGSSDPVKMTADTPEVGLPITDPDLAVSEPEGPIEPTDPEPFDLDAEFSTEDPEEDEAPKIQGPVQLGRYRGNNDMLLRYDEAKDKWVRMPPRSEVMTGSSLLTLPKFHAHVALADVNAYLSGGTRVGLPLSETGVGGDEVDLELSLDYGRVLLNASVKGSRVSLQVGDEVRRIQMEGSASLAVEVRRIFVPGSNNEQESSPVEATWYLTSGTIDWLVEADEPQTIQAPAQWTTVGGVDDLPTAIEELPEWIDHELMTDLQRRARDTLAEDLVPGEPVEIRLLELNDSQGKGRRSEVRTLAAEAGVYVGEFEPFVKALSDKDQRRAWETHIQTLRQALALSPDVAVKVHQAFIDQRGEQAAKDLMEMVSGYNEASIGDTPEAIQEGAVATLVRRLESDSLDYRVLAIHNLNEIFGTTSLKGFRPEDSSQRRKIAVAKIWESLESNELQPKP